MRCERAVINGRLGVHEVHMPHIRTLYMEGPDSRIHMQCLFTNGCA
jgi:hypothetical protein